METLPYLAKVNAYWLLFYACYWLLLRKHTFFHWNRFYLLGTLLIAFALPAIHFPVAVTTIYVPEPVYQKATISVAVIADKTPEASTNIRTWAISLYAAVVLALLCKFILGIIKVIQTAGRSERVDMGQYTLLMLPDGSGHERGSSFSFFRWLFLSAYDYRQNPDVVIRHEYEHIRQWHTLDILLIELLKIAFWANPIVWLYKHSIQTVHEYLADQPVPNRNAYASFLVAYALRSPDIAIANHFFNSSLLKNRITMIYKKRSSRWLLTKYALILPALVCSIAISASRAPMQSLSQPEKVFAQNIRVRGNITNESKEPVADAIVIIAGTTRGTTTDRNGWFELEDVPTNAKLVVTHVAYEPFEVTVASPQTELLLVLKKTVSKITGPVVVGKPLNAETPAVTNSPQPAAGKNMNVIEQLPEFPGGREALMQYLMQNLQYPETARKIHVEAIALVSFTVDKNGDIRNAHSLKDIGYGIDKEALRVINEMPRWNPAVQNGKPVEMEYTLEVNFKLDGEKQDKRQGFMNFNTHEPAPLPRPAEISTFFSGSLKRAKWDKFSDVAVGGAWTAVPRTTSGSFFDEKTKKQKHLKYGGYYMLPPAIIAK